MKRLFSKLFLAVFFVFGGILSFFMPVSLSYGDVPITGTITISNFDCIPSDVYNGESSLPVATVPFTIEVGIKSLLDNKSEGRYGIFLSAEQPTNIYGYIEPANDCTDCTLDYGGYFSTVSQAGGYDWTVSSTSNDINDFSLILKVYPEVNYNAGSSQYCPICNSLPANIKYRIYDMLNSYDEEFLLSKGLEKDVNFYSVSLDKDIVRYKFSGKKGDKVTVKASITNPENYSGQIYYNPRISLGKINYKDNGTVEIISDSYAGYEDFAMSLGSNGDYYLTIQNPLVTNYSNENPSACVPLIDLIPVHISVTAETKTGLVVNSTGDSSDTDVTDGACNTGKTTAGGDPECTLRAAMEEANARVGEDTITFFISGGTTSKASSIAPVIRPKKKLPVLKEAETIDATMQPGGKVELDGINAGIATGVSFSGIDGAVKGMIIKNFSGDGIYSAGEITVEDVEILDNNGFGINAVNTIDIFTSAKINHNEDGGIFTQHGSILAASIQSLEVVKNGGAGIWSKNKGSVVTLENVKINKNKGNGITMDGALTIYGTANQVSNNGGTGISNIGAVTDGRGIEIYGIEMLNNKGRGIYSTASVVINKQAKINENKKEGIWCGSSVLAGGVDFLEVIGNKGIGIKVQSKGSVVTLENAKVNKNKGNGITMDGSLTIYGISNEISSNRGTGISNIGAVTDGRGIEIDGIEMLNNKGRGIYTTASVVINKQAKINNNKKEGIWCESSVLAGSVDSLEVSRNGRHGITVTGEGEVAVLANIQINKNQGKGLKISGDLTANQGDVCGNDSGDIEAGGALNLTGVVYGKDCKAAATASP
ncbi:MAG: right-handed parallel beta-helix repeat-containing protein [Candidatus Schekmanbacteria bacterium]|nr:right-handed parallel beta-helix repeat-containing protein [Candidatus Schekmanbacteria bacterium]